MRACRSSAKTGPSFEERSMARSVSEDHPLDHEFVSFRRTICFDSLVLTARSMIKRAISKLRATRHPASASRRSSPAAGDAPGMNAVDRRRVRAGGAARRPGVRHPRRLRRTRRAPRGPARPADAAQPTRTSRAPGSARAAGRRSRPRRAGDAASSALEALGLDALVVIGGHGSALGARVLADAIPVAFVPATIDHDIDRYRRPPSGWTRRSGYAARDDRPAARHRPLAARPRVPRRRPSARPTASSPTRSPHAAGIDHVLVPERPIDLDAVAAALERPRAERATRSR